MKKKLAHVICGVLVFMIVATILMCVFWMPALCSYLCTFLTPVLSVSTAKVLLYTASVLLAFPLIFSFACAFYFVGAIKREEIFTVKCAKRLETISTIILCDCILFTGIAITFLFFGEKILCPALTFIGVIGIMVALMLYALSSYVKDAAILKEESDFTL